MPNQRDWDQMLKNALDMKATAQKFIDFAHMYGAGAGGEGEDDLEEQDDTEESDTEDAGEDPATENPPAKGAKMNVNPKAALLIAIAKKKKK